MNIALSAVIISILLISPVVFYLSLFIGKYPRATPKFSLFEGILASAVISLFIHSVAISCIPYDIRFDILIKVLGGDLKNVESTIHNYEFKKAVKDFALYNFSIFLIMIILGRIVRWIIKKFDLRSGNDIYNLYNKWWYFFNGYYANANTFDFVFVEAVVDTKDGTMIYSGFLEHFETRDGELDRLYLKDTIRREFKHLDNLGSHLVNEPGQPVQIPGMSFSLKYENIINLNVSFLLIDEETSNNATIT